MAWIRQITEAEASGSIGRVYQQARERAGGIANIIRVMSQDGPTTEASMQFYVRLMKSPNALSAARREMLAAVVSNVNDCYYWTVSHAMDFGRESGDQRVAEQLVLDYRTADLMPEDRALCDYAVRLTLRPAAMTEADVQRLRQLGFNDAAITIAVQVIGYFNYINRIADALHVDSEDWMTPPREAWLATKGTDYLDDGSS